MQENEPISTIVVEVQCAKETYELGQGLSKFVQDLKKAAEDGWQPGQDIPAAVSSAVANLLPAMNGVLKIKDEYQGSKRAFINGVLLPVGDTIGTILE